MAEPSVRFHRHLATQISGDVGGGPEPDVEGGYAPLDSGLLVPREYLPQIAGLLHNMSASAAPTVNDDSGDGYAVGSTWYDTTADVMYACLDATVGTAVWRLVTPGVATDYTPTWTSDGTAPAIGNGTLTGRYILISRDLAWIHMRFVRGSTSTNGTGNYFFSTPFTGVSGYVSTLAARLLDSTTAHFVGVSLIEGAASAFSTMIADAPGARTFAHTVPITLATNDELDVSGLMHITPV